MTEPRWLTATVILAMHADQIKEHGGSLGVRDNGSLESALDRPRNRFHYEPDSDLAQLAAAYGYGLARNHPFVDGNKRVAFQAMYVFLGLNGLHVQAEEEDVVMTMLRVASGDLQEIELGDWIRQNCSPR